MMVEWELYGDSAAEFELSEQVAWQWGSGEYVEIIEGGAEEYAGAYESTPTWEAQTYGTSGKLMRDDFTVNGIIELEVDNDAGGLTLTI